MFSARRIIVQNLILLAPLGLAFFWSGNEFLSSGSLQLISLAVIIFFTLQFLAKKMAGLAKIKNSLDFLLLTLVVYLIIFSTGGLLSPAFFLVYFLLFAVSLLFEPSAALSLATISSIFFLLNPRAELLSELLQLSSLFLITPLALIFGSQYLKLQQDKIIKADVVRKLEAVDNSTPSEEEAVQEIKEELEKQ